MDSGRLIDILRRLCGRRGERLLRSCLLLPALFLISTHIGAKPAYWYLWQSKTDNRYLCIQTTPGPGWQRVSGPYTRAQCNRFIKQLMIDPRPFSRPEKKAR